MYATENGGLCNMKNWTILTKLVMLNLECKHWEFTVELYGNMKIYKNVMQYKGPWFWWLFSKKKANLVNNWQMFLRFSCFYKSLCTRQSS